MTFNEIYSKYNRMVFNFLRSRMKDELLVEELTSDVMIRVHKSLHTYNKELSKISTWIMNIAKNAMIDHFRKKTLNVVSLENVYIEWVNGDEDAKVDRLQAMKCSEMNPEESMIETETRRSMVEKFQSLNETERLIASLYYFDGLSYDEVAAELNMPLGTVKAKIHNARVTMMGALPVEMRKLKTIA